MFGANGFGMALRSRGILKVFGQIKFRRVSAQTPKGLRVYLKVYGT